MSKEDIRANDVDKLVTYILKYFPKFFGDYDNWGYGNGTDAGKDFKKILNTANRIKKQIES